MNVRTDEYLISQLVSETCERASSTESSYNVIDLKHHFDKQSEIFDKFEDLIEYLEANSVKYLKYHYEEKSGCYRGRLGQQVIDFPSNWSLFSKVEGGAVHLAGNFDERELFIEMYREICSDIVEVAFYFSEDNLLIAAWGSDNFSKLYESFKFMKETKKAA